MKHLRNEFFQDDEYVKEFEDFAGSVTWSDRSPLNTEMLFMWSMIRSTKPELFIESGTFRGYSANFICEALKRNGNGAEFVTYGFNLENCLHFARKRLEKYPFAKVVEGDSKELLKVWPQEKRSTAFFIDGPKGKNMPPLLFLISRKFLDIQFISVHDCEEESGSHNRRILLNFFGREYPIMFCDSSFQEKFSYLDESLIGKHKMWNWRPYHWKGKKRDSYGVQTGYVLPILGKVGTPLSRMFFYLYRQFRFRIYHRLWLIYVDIRTR